MSHEVNSKWSDCPWHGRTIENKPRSSRVPSSHTNTVIQDPKLLSLLSYKFTMRISTTTLPKYIKRALQPRLKFTYSPTCGYRSSYQFYSLRYAVQTFSHIVCAIKSLYSVHVFLYHLVNLSCISLLTTCKSQNDYTARNTSKWRQ